MTAIRRKVARPSCKASDAAAGEFESAPVAAVLGRDEMDTAADDFGFALPRSGLQFVEGGPVLWREPRVNVRLHLESNVARLGAVCATGEEWVTINNQVPVCRTLKTICAGTSEIKISFLRSLRQIPSG